MAHFSDLVSNFLRNLMAFLRDIIDKAMKNRGRVARVIPSKIPQTLDTYALERNLLNSWLDNTSDHIYFKDLQGQIIRTSNSYARNLHLNYPEDLISKSDQHIYGEDCAPLPPQEQQAFPESNQVISGKIERIIDNEGVEHWYLSRNIPVKNDAGDSIGLLGIQQDMTYFKQAEELSARRADLLRTSAEIARDIAGTLELNELLRKSVKLVRERFGFYHSSIFLLDPVGQYAILRESTGEAGERMKSAGHKLAVGSRSIIGTATATGKPVIVNDVIQSPTYYPNPLLPDTHSEIGLPLKLADRIIGAVDLQSTKVNAFMPDDVAVLQILSDQIAIAIDNARLYEIAQKAVAEMLEVDRLKSQFLANMSHELRTPLNSIIGFSRVIVKGIDGPINDVQKQDLGAIYNSGQHLLALITDILDLSKMEAGKMELQFAEVNLSDLINSAMSTAVGLVRDKPIKLNHVVPTNLPSVMADATRVRQVLINLVSNAAKFTDEGSITIEAFDRVNQSGKPEIMVRVTDTGVGIAEEDRGKLFQPFSQVDDSPTRKTGGTGLGLSICKSLIEMHGGQIGLLYSELGKGSTFFFTLPLPTPEPEPNIHGLLIMAVDDDSQVINLYEHYLKPQGYFVVPVTDPTQALLRAKEIKPFAITLDIMMPVKDGWDVLKDLKNDPETRDIPIIICSILEKEERGFSLGAADYLVKPFLQEEIIRVITRINREDTINKVLVIDDDLADLRLVQKILEDMENYQVTTANGGKSGWEAITTIHPDAIILDLFMPDFNGFSILENLRKEPELCNNPVIILTVADLTLEQHQQLSDYGMHLLTKGLLRENELLCSLGTELKKIPRA